MKRNISGIDAVIQVMDYIEEHIEGDHTLDSLCSVAGYSAYHFARMFAFAVGYPAIEYVRRRRLWHAARDLKQSGASVLDIALRYGFQSHEGFSRAFARRFGMPPSQYRLRGAGIIPPIPYPAYIEGGLHMEPIFVTREDTATVGYLLHTAPQSPEIPAYWQELMDSGKFERLMGKSAKMENFGICITPKDDAEAMDYIVAFDYGGAAGVDADMVEFPLPGGLYAVFRAQDMSAICDTWTHIYTQWLPASRYEFDAARYDFELYPDAQCCDIYIPVKEK